MVKGAHWFASAAELGHAGAQFNLGYMYSVGLGVPRDMPKACYWYMKAAEQGQADAQVREREREREREKDLFGFFLY